MEDRLENCFKTVLTASADIQHNTTPLELLVDVKFDRGVITPVHLAYNAA